MQTHWTYRQSTGELSLDVPPHRADLRAYAGKGIGLNNPDMQHVKNVGPLPVGRYLINWATEAKHANWMKGFEHLGELALQLIPDPDNHMLGRSGFWIHGDNKQMNKTASNGCIILNRVGRLVVAASSYRILEVVR